MKKTYLLIGILLGVALTGSTWAMSTSFTDKEIFPEWASESIIKLNEEGIINGYEDGSFRPNNYVTRAELSVMLDRYDENITNSNSTQSNIDQDTLFRLTENMVLMENLETSYKAQLILANTGFKKINSAPDLSGFNKIESENIPSNYEVYTRFHSEAEPIDIYIMIEEPILNGDIAEGKIKQWYGPFN